MRRGPVGPVLVLALLALIPEAGATDIGKTPEGNVIALIDCPFHIEAKGSLHWPEKIASSPAFSFAGGAGLPKPTGALTSIGRAGQLVRCTYRKEPGQGASIHYQYKVKRTIVNCTHPNPNTLRCELKP